MVPVSPRTARLSPLQNPSCSNILCNERFEYYYNNLNLNFISKLIPIEAEKGDFRLATDRPHTAAGYHDYFRLTQHLQRTTCSIYQIIRNYKTQYCIIIFCFIIKNKKLYINITVAVKYFQLNNINTVH